MKVGPLSWRKTLANALRNSLGIAVHEWWRLNASTHAPPNKSLDASPDVSGERAKSKVLGAKGKDFSAARSTLRLCCFSYTARYFFSYPECFRWPQPRSFWWR